MRPLAAFPKKTVDKTASIAHIPYSANVALRNGPRNAPSPNLLPPSAKPVAETKTNVDALFVVDSTSRASKFASISDNAEIITLKKKSAPFLLRFPVVDAKNSRRCNKLSKLGKQEKLGNAQNAASKTRRRETLEQNERFASEKSPFRTEF